MRVRDSSVCSLTFAVIVFSVVIMDWMQAYNVNNCSHSLICINHVLFCPLPLDRSCQAYFHTSKCPMDPVGMDFLSL